RGIGRTASARRPLDGRDALVRLGRMQAVPRSSHDCRRRRTSLPGGAPAAPVAHDPTRTGTEFVHTAPQAQHDRPNRYHCGDRRTRCESASAFGGGYPRRVRRVVVLTAIAAALTGCGSGATEHTPIVFGITGGNIVPYRVSIQ